MHVRVPKGGHFCIRPLPCMYELKSIYREKEKNQFHFFGLVCVCVFLAFYIPIRVKHIRICNYLRYQACYYRKHID